MFDFLKTFYMGPTNFDIEYSSRLKSSYFLLLNLDKDMVLNFRPTYTSTFRQFGNLWFLFRFSIDFSEVGHFLVWTQKVTNAYNIGSYF